MAERGGDAVAGAVTGDSTGVDGDDLGRGLHGKAVSKGAAAGQYPQ